MHSEEIIFLKKSFSFVCFGGGIDLDKYGELEMVVFLKFVALKC